MLLTYEMLRQLLNTAYVQPSGIVTAVSAASLLPEPVVSRIALSGAAKGNNTITSYET